MGLLWLWVTSSGEVAWKTSCHSTIQGADKGTAQFCTVPIGLTMWEFLLMGNGRYQCSTRFLRLAVHSLMFKGWLVEETYFESINFRFQGPRLYPLHHKNNRNVHIGKAILAFFHLRKWGKYNYTAPSWVKAAAGEQEWAGRFAHHTCALCTPTREMLMGCVLTSHLPF